MSADAISAGAISAGAISASAVYAGTIRHRRFVDGQRSFTHPLAMTYLDLDELPALTAGPLARRRPGSLSFRRSDYHGPRDQPLAQAVRETVAGQLGEAPPGPIRLLSQLRSWGVSFNPISLYYCFTADGRRLHSVLAEVTNTPWGERHAYALRAAEDGPVLRADIDKRMHVSPFLGMDQTYEITLTAPRDTLSLHLNCTREGTVALDATLGLRRAELTPASLRALVRRQPFGALGNLARIYAHGVGLALAGVQHYPHPAPSQS